MSLLLPTATTPMCFQSKLHPNVKQNRCRVVMNQHVCASKIVAHKLSTMTSLRSGVAPEQPSADQTKQRGRAKMKPRHQIRQQGGKVRRERKEPEQKRGKYKSANHESDKKTIVSGI